MQLKSIALDRNELSETRRRYSLSSLAGISLSLIIIVIAGGIGYLALSNLQGTSILSTTNTISTFTSSTTNGKYNVTFQQIGACPPHEFWGIPWSITINGVTMVQPSGTPLPLDNNVLYGTGSPTAITFFLGAGNYNYTVNPSQGFFTPDSGNVTVTGNETVPIAYTGTSCTEQSTASTSTTSP
jgi:hypothetical protein